MPYKHVIPSVDVRSISYPSVSPLLLHLSLFNKGSGSLHQPVACPWHLYLFTHFNFALFCASWYYLNICLNYIFPVFILFWRFWTAERRCHRLPQTATVVPPPANVTGRISLSLQEQITSFVTIFEMLCFVCMMQFSLSPNTGQNLDELNFICYFRANL